MSLDDVLVAPSVPIPIGLGAEMYVRRALPTCGASRLQNADWTNRAWRYRVEWFRVLAVWSVSAVGSKTAKRSEARPPVASKKVKG